MIYQLEKIAHQPIPDLRTATGTLDYCREHDKPIVFLDFQLESNTPTFLGVTVTEFKASDAGLYLWQTYSGNASPQFPTLQIKKASKDLFDKKTGSLSLATSKKAKKLLKCLEEFPAINPITKQIEQNHDIARALDAKIRALKSLFLASVSMAKWLANL
jgi:hypothetical protein